MQVFWRNSRGMVVAVMVLGGLVATPGYSKAQDKVAKNEEPLKANEGPFVIPEEPWKRVFDWFCDRSGLPMAGSTIPGVFSLPAVHEPLITLNEVFDLLNESMAKNGVMLLKRQGSMYLYATDERVPLELVRSVERAELVTAASSDFVKTTFALRHFNVDIATGLVSRLLSPGGSVHPTKEKNQLLLAENGLTLQRVWLLLRAMDRPDGNSIPHRSWKETLDWLSDVTMLPLGGRVIPVVPICGPLPRVDTVGSIGEIIDGLNESLAPQNLLILRGDKAINVVWTDEAINPSLVPHLRWAELEQRGKTEVVSIDVEFKDTKAGDRVPVVRAMLSRFGVVSEQAGNRLTVRDMAGNLRVVLKELRNYR